MRKKTLNEFKEELYKINPNIEVIGEYINTDTRIECKCKICNHIWETPPRGLLQGTGCPKCAYKNRWDTRGRITTDIAKAEISKNNPNLIMTSDYNGSHSNIECKCLIHDITFLATYSNIRNGNTNCPLCSKEYISEISSLSDEGFLEIMDNKYPFIKPLGKYRNRYTEISFHCNVHNIDFKSKPYLFMYNKVKGCPQCSSSIGENRMISILTSMGFDVKRQYTFDDCKNIKVLPFDGFIKEINTAFEYQGEQHYKNIYFNGYRISEDKYKEALKRDKIKEDYCMNHNINLVKIPYWEFDNMENYIINQLNLIQ